MLLCLIAIWIMNNVLTLLSRTCGWLLDHTGVKKSINSKKLLQSLKFLEILALKNISDKSMLFFLSVKMKSSPVQFFHELLIKCLVQFFTEVSLPAPDFTLTKKTWFWRINWQWKRVRIFLHFGKCALMGDFSNHFYWQRFLKKFTDSANITTQVLKEI